MLLSAVRRSSRLLGRYRLGGNVFRGRVPTPLSPKHRKVSTSPLACSVPESVQDHGGGQEADNESERHAAIAQSVSKWNIDPLTGKKRVGNNWNYHAELSALAHRVGIDSLHLPSLQVALWDQSARVEEPSSQKPHPKDHRRPHPGDHGRLSVLGHSVMQHYVQEYLYFNYPELEGSMLRDIANFLKSESVLVELSGHLGLTQLIQTKKILSEPSNLFVVTKAFCAVIGVLYEKQGGKAARSFVHDFVITQLASKDLRELIKLQHPRFMLHAILKGKGRPRPVSRLIKESGRATHFPSFVVGIYSGEEPLGEGCGTSIKRAEREAMVTALQTHFQMELSDSPLPSDHDDFIREERLQLMVDFKEEAETITPPQL